MRQEDVDSDCLFEAQSYPAGRRQGDRRIERKIVAQTEGQIDGSIVAGSVVFLRSGLFRWHGAMGKIQREPD